MYGSKGSLINKKQFLAIPVLTGPALKHALVQTLAFFSNHGHMPKEQRMDNQTSAKIHKLLTNYQGPQRGSPVLPARSLSGKPSGEPCQNHQGAH